MRFMLLAMACCITPFLAQAKPMETSLRPLPRPALASAMSTAGTLTSSAPKPETVRPADPVGKLRPKARPAIAAVAKPVPATPQGAETGWPRPQPRPRGWATSTADTQTVAIAAPPPKTKTKTTSKKGAVCGDPSIKGQVIAAITSRSKGCGVAEPVRITSVAGVALSDAAIMDCTTAKALKTWVVKGLQPAVGNTKVVKLQIAAHYVCRSRNNQKGAPLSQHAKGKAIDISAVILADGRVLNVAGDWGKTLRRAYKAACGIFGTTLGPGSDGYHEDHMHFDTTRYRKGSYCR